MSQGGLDTVGECATAIKSHIETCNDYRSLWLKIAGGLISYIIIVSVFVGTTLIGHSSRIDGIRATQDSDRLAMATQLQGAIKEINAAQIADRASFQATTAADRQRQTDAIQTVTASQIERTKQALDAMEKSNAMTRDELKSIRDEIGRMREKIEALALHSTRK